MEENKFIKFMELQNKKIKLVEEIKKCNSKNLKFKI